MSFSIDSARQKASKEITDCIIDYLGPAGLAPEGIKKKGREEEGGYVLNFINSTPYFEASPETRKRGGYDLSVERDSYIRTFFLNFIHTRPSFLKYDTSISFDEFASRDLTRHLSYDQRYAINTHKISASQINEFILKLQTKGGIVDIAADMDHYEDFPRYTLIAHLKRGDVTVAQVASSCLLYQAIEQFIMDRTYTLCEEIPGNPPTVSYCYLKVGAKKPLPLMRTFSLLENKDFIKRYFNLSNYGMETMLSLLEAKPDSEKYYHTITLPLSPIHTWSPGHQRVTDLIKFLYPVAVGQSIQFETVQQQVMVIPSFSMLEVFNKNLYEVNAISYVPLLGKCTKATISFFKRLDKRVLHVGMPQAPVPDLADNHYFGPHLYSIHDFYHGVRDAWIALGERRAINQIVDRIFSKRINEKTEEIQWKLDDGELYHKSQHFGHLFDPVRQIPWDDAHKRALLTDMALLSDFWQAEFSIPVEKLLPPEKEIYDSILPTITDAQRKKARIDLFNYYKTHARKEDPFAQFRLGAMYGYGYGTEISYPDALKHWELSGLDGAFYQIGLCYREGKGVKPSAQNVFKYFLRAAKTHSEAQFSVGWAYYSGEKGIAAQDFKKALIYFERAAKQGHRLALLNLGVMCRDGEGCEINLKKALDCFQTAAEAGLNIAQCELGMWHHKGKAGVVTQDFAKAFSYFSKAAKQGHTLSHYYLGLMYKAGEGCEKNLTEAFAHLQEAAEAGLSLAQVELGKWYSSGVKDIVPKDFDKSLSYFNRAALQGNKSAQYSLAVIYENGILGVKKDVNKALSYFQQAADAGDDSAQFDLGMYYYNGSDGIVAQDFGQAMKYLVQAAKQGHLVATHNLGVMYRDGQGCQINLQTALGYFQQAADAGYTNAQVELGAWYMDGKEDVVAKDARKALYYFEMAAKKKNLPAMYNAGIMYREGEGCEKNLKKAFDYFQEAADAGYVEAQAELGVCYYLGLEGVVAKDLVKAIIHYEMAAQQGLERAKHNLDIVRKEIQSMVS